MSKERVLLKSNKVTPKRRKELEKAVKEVLIEHPLLRPSKSKRKVKCVRCEHIRTICSLGLVVLAITAVTVQTITMLHQLGVI